MFFWIEDFFCSAICSSRPSLFAAEAALLSIERKQARVARNGAAKAFDTIPGGFGSCTVSFPDKARPAFFRRRPASWYFMLAASIRPAARPAASAAWNACAWTASSMRRTRKKRVMLSSAAIPFSRKAVTAFLQPSTIACFRSDIFSRSSVTCSCITITAFRMALAVG